MSFCYKTSIFVLMVIFVSACASSPQQMREKPPYYEANINMPLAKAIDCVSKKIDEIELGISDPISQSVRYLSGSEDGLIYISSSQLSNIAIIDFKKTTKTKETNVQLRYNSNVLMLSENISGAIQRCI